MDKTVVKEAYCDTFLLALPTVVVALVYDHVQNRFFFPMSSEKMDECPNIKELISHIYSKIIQFPSSAQEWHIHRANMRKKKLLFKLAFRKFVFLVKWASNTNPMSWKFLIG